MTRLSVNVNKIATLRNTRATGVPSVVRLSAIALDAGAHGITAHPRPDQRHIRYEDVDQLAALVARYPTAEYNVEGNPFHGLIEHCLRARPAQATFVPDAREAFTSNHGWNLVELGTLERQALSRATDVLHASGCRVSLFVNPIPEMMPLARDLGVDRVELYTEPYAAMAVTGCAEGLSRTLRDYALAAKAARDAGLGVNAGHDLNLDNLGMFLDRVSCVDEVSIGHALTADALEFGLRETVLRYLAVCARSR